MPTKFIPAIGPQENISGIGATFPSKSVHNEIIGEKHKIFNCKK